MDLSNFNTIEQNHISHSQILEGIAIVESSSNIINNNTAQSNEKYGVILDGSYDNIVENNRFISNNESGIYCINSYENTFEKNHIKENKKTGLFIAENSHQNTFLLNVFDDNNKTNFYITKKAVNNSFYYNNFLNNHDNKNKDYGENIWNTNIKGNYWSDYSTKYPEAQKLYFRGIWNNPYDIEGGSNSDHFPLINECYSSMYKDQLKENSIRRVHTFLFNLYGILYENSPLYKLISSN